MYELFYLSLLTDNSQTTRIHEKLTLTIQVDKTIVMPFRLSAYIHKFEKFFKHKKVARCVKKLHIHLKSLKNNRNECNNINRSE